MRKDKARAIAICALIDDAIKYGYPETYKGKIHMDAAIRWLEDESSPNKRIEPTLRSAAHPGR